MKLTKTQLFVGGLIVVVAAVVGFVIHSSAPKDTPIVIIGSSIHVNLDPSDSTGWNPQGSLYVGIVSRSLKNNNGIDRLQFNNLETNPQVMTQTGGWAITAANTDKPHKAKKDYAVRLCSDATCSASIRLMDGTKNNNQCQSPFNQFGPVYVGARSDSWLEQKSLELHYHDRDGNCDGSNGTGESDCDWPIQYTVETCRPLTSTTYACMGKGCGVQVGTK